VGAASHSAGASSGSSAYSAVDLGSLGGSYSEAFRISDSGDVVGGSLLTNDAAFHAFAWTTSTGMTDLGTLGGGWSTSSGVNATGSVVGTSNLQGTTLGQDVPYHAFLWAPSSGMRDLGTLGGRWSQATAINDAGAVVGISEGPSGSPSQRAFLWTATGGMVDLGTLGGNFAQAWAINKRGQVVGNSTLPGDNVTHTFLWSAAAGMQDLGGLGGVYSDPTAISDTGQVVGFSYLNDNSAYHAYSWTQATGMQDLGTLGGANSQAAEVSDGGVVVGGADVAGGGPGHAFSWTSARGMQDLGDLSGAGSSAIAVDGNGRAVGGGVAADNEEHPVFWAAPGATSDLPTLGGVYGQPNAANACGQVAGGSDLAGDQEEHATLWLPNTSFVGRCGMKLTADQQSYRPVGINIYNANSRWNCWYDMASGTTLDDSLNAIGSGKNAIRAWFFQDLATTNGQRDWTAFDHTLAVAHAHGVKVIATLGNQWADCEPLAGYKDTAWYSGGYKQSDPGGTVSYRAWVQEVAARYKDDPTVLAWQLMNEPEVLPQKDGDCGTVPESTAYGLLAAFASDVSGAVKAVDPNHLISLGTIGSGQCGAQADDFTKLMSIPTLDLCEFHDYNQTDLIPGDQWNGLQTRIDECNTLDKPLLVGELGIIPDQVGGTLADRANVIASKLCAQLSAGAAGMLVWAWDKDGSLLNTYDIGPGDPALGALTLWSNPSHSCSPPAAPSGVVAAAGAESVAVSWLPPGTDGGSPVTSYTVTSNPGGITKTVSGKTRTATISSLADGTAYTFTVSATNAAGTGPTSAASAAATPQANAGTPAAVTASAPASSTTTVSTGSDPSTIGGTSSSVTVPSGTSGGTVTVTQSGTSSASPTGYQFGGVQVDITAPSGTRTNSLTLVFTTTPPAGATLDAGTLAATDIYRSEGGGTSQLIPLCATAVPVDPEPACVANRQYVQINGSTYIQLTVSAETASRWNTARPTTVVVSVSNAGYTPATATVAQGGRASWTFNGSKAHSVTDALNLGASAKPLFDSGAKTGGGYSYAFIAAGTYSYKSTVKGDTTTGTIAIPLTISHAGSNYVLIWAAAQLSGYVFDVQYRYKSPNTTKWSSWTSWKAGTANTAAAFTPAQGKGTYSFHARLRNAATGKSSGDAPDSTITIN
jgi:probable HAF family extracellular repeat protein